MCQQQAGMRGDWKLFGEASGELLSDLKECMGRPCLGHWAALNTSTNIVASMTSNIFIDPLAHVRAIRCLLANLLSPEILGWFSACCAALAVPKTACVANTASEEHAMLQGGYMSAIPIQAGLISCQFIACAGSARGDFEVRRGQSQTLCYRWTMPKDQFSVFVRRPTCLSHVTCGLHRMTQ